jgi:LysR family hydrogen peroxide-inducible transcriptional activator
MDLGDLSLKDLQYVLAVAEHLNFSRAAEECHVSQPALSKQIKNLEGQLGVSLFERSKRQVLLTSAGQVFCTKARRVLDEAETLLNSMSSMGQPLSGVFRLGVIASSCPYLMPYCVAALQQQFPALQLLLTEGLTEPLLEQLRQGRLDAIIAANTISLDGLEERPLYFEPFQLAVSRERYQKQPATIRLKEIDTQQLLLLEDGHCLKDQTTALCMIPQTRSAQQFKATSLETLLHMTAGGVGIAIIPALAIPHQSQLAERLVFSQFAEANSGRIMSLYSRKPYPFPANLDSLAALIRSCVPESVKPCNSH